MTVLGMYTSGGRKIVTDQPICCLCLRSFPPGDARPEVSRGWLYPKARFPVWFLFPGALASRPDVPELPDSSDHLCGDCYAGREATLGQTYLVRRNHPW